MRERSARMREVMDAAVRTATFPVIGLAGDVPTPSALGGVAMRGETLTTVTLTYGFEHPRPLVMVRTGLLERDGPVGFGRSSTEELEHWDEDDGGDAVGQIANAVDVEVAIGDQQVPARYRAGRRAWSLEFQLELDSALLDVLVISRERTLGELRLERIHSLEPFIAGRHAFEHALREQAELQREPEPEEWELPPIEGLAAHEELIRTTLEEQRRFARLRDSKSPRRPPDRDGPRQWEAATRAQMALADESRAKATEAVERLVNQVLRLSDTAAWFEDQILAELAITECIEHAALQREVASEDAQRTWARYWAPHTRPRPLPLPGEPPSETAEEVASRFGGLAEAERDWRAAWLRWVEAKP